MKTFALKILVFVAMGMPAVSYGFFGMLGRDQCGHQQTPFPVNGNDYASADQQRLKGLKEYRGTLTDKMAKLNADMKKAQGVIRAYFNAPWSDAMFAHMDNEFDCCNVRPTSAKVLRATRMPAGNSVDGPDAYVDDEVVTNPEPEDSYTEPEDTAYTEPTPGQHCLQTGFAAGRDWNKHACRDGGQIDPQICSNASISKAPGNYQKCIGIIKIYRDLASQKRTLSTQIADLDAQISPTRAGNDSGDNKKGGFLSGIGNLLGGVISVALPFIVNQYASYTAKKQAANMPQGRLPGPRQVLAPPNAGRNMYGPGPRERSGTLGFNQMQAPPPFYGPNYGYGMGYGGQYGQSLPGFQTGGFGCSPGMLGGGLNMLAMLMGGMSGQSSGMGGMMAMLLGGGMNMNANLNANFSLMGGAAPYAGMQMAYGNNYPAVPPYSMGGFTPPYQPGGIYGGTPTYIPNFNGSAIPNYYTGQQNPSYTAPPMGCPSCISPLPPNTSYMNAGNNSNSFYYAQQMNNNQRLMENQAMQMRQQSELEYQLYQLRMMNGQNTPYTSTNYQMGNTNGLNSSLYGF